MGCTESNKLEFQLLSDRDLARCVWDVLVLQKTGCWPKKQWPAWIEACTRDIPKDVSVNRMTIAMNRLHDAVYWRFYERARQEDEDLPLQPVG